MSPPSDGKRISGMEILRRWQALNFELNDNLTWRFLKEVEELSLTKYTEEQICRAFNKTRKLKDARKFIDLQSPEPTNLDSRLTLEQAMREVYGLSFNLNLEMSLVDSNFEDSFGFISENNLSTQAYSTNYLDSISDGYAYSDNGLVSEEEIIHGFERTSEDELLSQEELDQVQIFGILMLSIMSKILNSDSDFFDLLLPTPMRISRYLA